MLKDLLEGLGLNSREIKVYMAVLDKQRVIPAQIAQITKLNRPTIYGIAKKLVARGLLIEDLGGKALYLMPASPIELKALIKKEQEESRSKISIIEELSQEISVAKSASNYPVPKIRFIEERGLENYLYTRSPAWEESIKQYDNCWWGFQDHFFVEQYTKWIDWYWKQAPKDIVLRLLSNRAEIEKKIGKRYPRREIKPWENSEGFTATTWIVGDYIVMITADEKPFYLVEIHDKRMAHNMREVFKNLWELV